MGRKRKRSPQAPGSAASTPSQKRPKKNGETPSKPAPQADLRSLAGPFQADLTKEERAREAALYKTLGSELEADRLAAADIIIESLLGTSSSRPGSGSDAGRTTNNGQAQGPTATTDAPSAAVPSTPAPVPVPEPVLERHLDRRLFRGLASGANASRIGFSLVLTEVLERLFKRDGLAGTTYPGLTFDRVLGLLVSNTQVTGAAGSVTGQEERDHHFGRLFGLECFVRANILFGSHSSSSSSGSGKEKRWKKVLDLLLALANTKVWLRPQCGWMIVQAVHHAGMRAKEARRTLRALADAGLAETPEGVAVWLACVSRFPEIADGVSEDGESDKWRNPMAPSSLDRLAAILKDGGRQHQQQTSDAGGDGERAAKKQSQSNWTAQLHFVWDLIRAYFVRMELDDERSALTSFRLFWNRVVDEGLFSRNASDTQKYSGFMVFQLMLSPGATHDFILASIFSQNFMTCLMNQAAAENRYLHRAALKALASIEQAVEAEPEILQPILKGLLTGNGDYCFDQRTHGKTIEHLLSKAPESDKVPIISLLRTPVLNMKGSEPQQIENKRRLYAEYLLQLASGCLAADSDTARANLLLILKELIRVAYSKAGDFDPPLTETTRDIARIRVGTAFSKAIKTPSNCPVVCDAILSADLDGVEMDDELSTEYRTAFTQLHQYRHENVDDSYGLSLLYAAAIYLLLNGDEDAVEILNDLYDCGDPMRLPAGVRDKPDADKIFVEILLNLVSRPSAFMKQVTHRVFENFALNVDENALRLLTDPLAVEENIKGKETLFGTGESGGQEEDEEDENDSDVETVDTAAAGAGAESDAEQLEDESSSAASDSGSGDNEDDSSSAGDDSSSLEDDSSSDDEAQDNGDSQALDDALAKILNSHRLDKDAEAESSSDDSDMTDNEMIAIDKQLTEAFKMRVQRKSTKKKDQKSAKEAVVNFKNRVLDFIDIYVKVAPTKKESFGLLLPLLRLVRTTKNKNLATRACGTIVAFWKAFSRERSSKRNPFPLEKLDASGMPALLEAIHKDASLDPSHAYAKAASTASILVSSVLLHTAVSREAGVERIWTAYGKTMADWVTGKIRVQPSFFTECVNWLQGYASTAAMADG